MHYLIEMKTAPVTTIPTREDAIAITERFVIPTLEACARLQAERRIVAGGPALGATSLIFTVDVDTPEALEPMLVGLPLWPRVQTTITPLGSFAERLVFTRERLTALKAAGGPVASIAPARSAAQEPASLPR